MRDFNQAVVSDGVSFFKDGILKRWPFDKYSSKSSPTVFFGVYNKEDVDKINQHKGYKVIMFLGKDRDRHGHLWKDDPKAFHVAYGAAKKKLESKGVRVFDHVTPLKSYSEYTPTELGDCIYVYKGAFRSDRDHYSWESVVKPLIREFGSRIIWTQGKSEEELRSDFYSKCFAYVKPNPTAGSITMWEMAHMGRKTFTQGHSDLGFGFTEDYTDVTDLIEKLKKEELKVGMMPLEVSQSANAALDNSDDWLNLKYYGVE